MLNVTHSEFKGKCGIYLVENLLNGKKYVGSSKDMYYRLRRHLSDLRKRQHGNQHWQNSFNKYGEKIWFSKILETCLEEELLNREEYYMKLLKPEYNKILTPNRPVLSQSSRDKVSATLRRLYASGEKTTYRQDHAQIPTHIYDIFGDYMQTFPCATEAGKFLNTSATNIRRNRNNKNMIVDFTQNYFFSAIKKDNISQEIIETIKYNALNNLRISFPLLKYNKQGLFERCIFKRKGLEMFLPDLRKDLYRKFKKPCKGFITFAGYKLTDVYDTQ